MQYARFITDEEIEHAAQLVKDMEQKRNIKFTKKEFDQMVMTLIDPLLATEFY